MSGSVNLGEFLAKYTQRLLSTTAKSIEDLSPEELHYQANAEMNSIGFDAWHIARTADNLVHFAFEREQPVWLQQGLNEAWDLPKADQGTGMDSAVAHALRFPDAKLLAQYCRDVSSAIVPRMEKMSPEYLATATVIKPQGEMARLDVINQVIVVHGNNHLGQISLARTLQGKPGLGF